MIRVLLLIAATLLTACATPGEAPPPGPSPRREKAAAEIDRICALPEDERQAEIRKIKQESGLELYCTQE